VGPDAMETANQMNAECAVIVKARGRSRTFSCSFDTAPTHAKAKMFDNRDASAKINVSKDWAVAVQKELNPLSTNNRRRLA
jgi:hypothetical protein